MKKYEGMFIFPASTQDEALNAVIERINLICTKPEVGEVYEGTIKTITAFGAFVEFLPNTDGLLHVTEIAYRHIDNVEDVLKVGDKIKVKLIEIDEKTGKFRLSHKVLLPKPEGYSEEKPRNNGPRGPRNNDRRGGDRNDRGPRNGNHGPRGNNHGPRNNGNRDAQPRQDAPQTPELPDFPELD